MPRRGKSSSAPMSAAPRRTMTSAPPPAPVQRAPVPVAHQPAPMAMPAPTRQGPGLLGQVAATAAGVGIGSAIGHTVGHAITGGFGGGSEKEVAAPQQPAYAAQPYQQPNQSNDPCGFEMRQFMECAQQNSSDLSLCSGFNEVLKACKMRSGPQPQYM